MVKFAGLLIVDHPGIHFWGRHSSRAQGLPKKQSLIGIGFIKWIRHETLFDPDGDVILYYTDYSMKCFFGCQTFRPLRRSMIGWFWRCFFSDIGWDDDCKSDLCWIWKARFRWGWRISWTDGDRISDPTFFFLNRETLCCLLCAPGMEFAVL